jgi:hypothetical protein
MQGKRGANLEGADSLDVKDPIVKFNSGNKVITTVDNSVGNGAMSSGNVTVQGP